MKLDFINSYDVFIAKTKDGDEVAQFKNAFDEDFINMLRENGVKDKPIREEEEEEE